MKALVIGAGGVGRAIINIASRRPFITSMVIADRTLSRAQEAVHRVRDPRFSAAQVNAAELEDLRELIRKADPDVVTVDPEPDLKLEPVRDEMGILLLPRFPLYSFRTLERFSFKLSLLTEA